MIQVSFCSLRLNPYFIPVIATASAGWRALDATSSHETRISRHATATCKWVAEIYPYQTSFGIATISSLVVAERYSSFKPKDNLALI